MHHYLVVRLVYSSMIGILCFMAACCVVAAVRDAGLYAAESLLGADAGKVNVPIFPDSLEVEIRWFCRLLNLNTVQRLADKRFSLSSATTTLLHILQMSYTFTLPFVKKFQSHGLT